MSKHLHLILVALLMAALIAGCGWSSGGKAGIGQVKEVLGQPGVFRGNDYLTLGPDSVIEQQDSVLTGPADRITIVLKDGTTLGFGADTQITVHEYVRKGKAPTLRLTSTGGHYRLSLGKRLKKETAINEINTPFGMIHMAASEILVSHSDSPGQLTVVLLGAGSVHLVNAFGEARLLNKGDTSTVSFGRSPSVPQRLSERELLDAIESVSFFP